MTDTNSRPSASSAPERPPLHLALNHPALAELPAVAELVALGRRFVCWCWELRGTKWQKPPRQPNCELASTTNSATWCDFETAVGAVRAGTMHGIGFVLDATADGIVGVDLDGCRDPETGAIAPWTLKIVEAVKSYAEVSPSGTGVKIIARADPVPTLAANRRTMGKAANGHKQPAVEAYTTGSYFCITGHRLAAAPDEIVEATAELEQLAAWLANKGATKAALGTATKGELPAAFVALLKRDAKLRDAWQNGTKLGQGGDNTASALDWALAQNLRPHLRDADIAAVLRLHSHGQIGSGKIKGRVAERRIENILAELPLYRPEHKAGANRQVTEPPEPPRPLMRPSEPAAAYPVECLGTILGNAAKAIHDKIRAPLAICASAVLAAATMVAQAFADVLLPTGQIRPLSSYFLSVAETGERKSSADIEAMKQIKEHETKLHREYKLKFAEYMNKLDSWKAERAAILADKKLKGRITKEEHLKELGAMPTAPLTAQLTPSEPTYEGLCKLLATGYPSVGVFSAEGGQFIGGHAMNEENRIKTAAAMSHLWDSGEAKRTRADGASTLYGRRVSLHLMVQPGVANLLLCDARLADQGILSRLLVTAPDSLAGKRPWHDPKPESGLALAVYDERLKDMLEREPQCRLDDGNQRKPQELDPRALSFSPAARELWIEWSDHCDAELAAGGSLEPIRHFANKLPEHAARIAAVLTLIADPDAKEISRDHLASAIELVKHYAAETARLARAGLMNPDLQLASTTLGWLHSDKWADPLISLPDLYQFGPNPVRDLATARRVVAILAEHEWLAAIDGGGIVKGAKRRQAWAILGREPKL